MPDIYKSEIVRGWAHDLSIGFKNNDYVANHPFPLVTLDSPKQQIWKHNKGDAYRSQAVLRGPGARSQMRHRKGTSVSVDTNEYGIAERITDKDLEARKLPAGAVPPIDLIGDAVESNADQHDLRVEIATAAHINAATWSGGNMDAEGTWSPLGSTNTFIADLMTGISKLRTLGCNVKMLGLLVDGQTWDPLAQCDDLVDRIKHTGRDSITEVLLANLFNLKEVVIGSAMKNTADEKADGSDSTLVQIWESTASKGMGFLYQMAAKIKPSLKMRVAGLSCRNKLFGNGQGRISERWYEKPYHAWTVETRQDDGIVTIDTDSGYLYDDTFAT